MSQITNNDLGRAGTDTQWYVMDYVALRHSDLGTRVSNRYNMSQIANCLVFCDPVVSVGVWKDHNAL